MFTWCSLLDQTWWHWTMALAGSGMMPMALAGLFMVRIHMIRVDSLDSDYGNLLVEIYHEFSWILINFWSTFESGQKCTWEANTRWWRPWVLSLVCLFKEGRVWSDLGQGWTTWSMDDGSRCLLWLIWGCTGCERKADRLHWDIVPWPIRYVWRLISSESCGVAGWLTWSLMGIISPWEDLTLLVHERTTMFCLVPRT